MSEKFDKAAEVMNALSALAAIRARITVKCQKCSREIPMDDTEIHNKKCPWICGLCGKAFMSFKAHAAHASRCDAPMLMFP